MCNNVKKMMIIGIVVLFFVSSLAGCSDYISPRVTIRSSKWTENNVNIDVGRYEYVDYEKIIKEDGSCSLIINFTSKNTK